jgi:hypothetical protein
MVSQGSPASSTPLLMHVDDMQVPMSVQDIPGLFEEMPVYDVYEEDRSASLNFVSELCEIVGHQNQYASEKPIYDCEEPHCGAKLSSGNLIIDCLQCVLITLQIMHSVTRLQILHFQLVMLYMLTDPSISQTKRASWLPLHCLFKEQPCTTLMRALR